VVARNDPEQRLAVFMTSTENITYTDRDHDLAEEEALEAALKQLELSTSHTQLILDAALVEVVTALSVLL
jgi:hypothetical protein